MPAILAGPALAMRGIVALTLVAAVGACGRAASGIEGRWLGQTQAAVEYEMFLSERSGVVTGTGTYTISGPRPTGSFQARGTFSAPAVTVLIIHDSGTEITFNGTLETSSRLVGSVTYTTRSGDLRSEAMTFFKIVR